MLSWGGGVPTGWIHCARWKAGNAVKVLLVPFGLFVALSLSSLHISFCPHFVRQRCPTVSRRVLGFTPVVWLFLRRRQQRKEGGALFGRAPHRIPARRSPFHHQVRPPHTPVTHRQTEQWRQHVWHVRACCHERHEAIERVGA